MERLHKFMSGSSSAKKEKEQQLKSFIAARHDHIRVLHKSSEKEKADSGRSVASRSSSAKKENDQQLKSFFATRHDHIRTLHKSSEKEKYDSGRSVESGSSSAKKKNEQQMKSFHAARHDHLRMRRKSSEKEKTDSGRSVESHSSSAKKENDQQMKSFFATRHDHIRTLHKSSEKEKAESGRSVESHSSSAKKENEQRMKSFLGATYDHLRMLQESSEKEKADSGRSVESGFSAAKKEEEPQMKSFLGATYDHLRMLQKCSEEEKANSGRPVEPCFEDYQLIGDSILLRFSEQLLFYKCKTDEFNGARALGLCVSGQTVGELCQRIDSKTYTISKKVILLIGTNDMLRDTKMDLMKRNLKRVVKELMGVTKRIIVLTLPPVPRLSYRRDHWQRLYEYNTYIKRREKYKNVVVADITSLFLIGPERCRVDCYELFYSGTRRPDRVHLNKIGLQKIYDFLLQKQLLTD